MIRFNDNVNYLLIMFFLSAMNIYHFIRHKMCCKNNKRISTDPNFLLVTTDGNMAKKYDI